MDAVFRTGSFTSALYQVRSGAVILLRRHRDGGKRYLVSAFLGRGSIFSEQCLIERTEYTYAARVLSSTAEIAEIDRSEARYLANRSISNIEQVKHLLHAKHKEFEAVQKLYAPYNGSTAKIAAVLLACCKVDGISNFGTIVLQSKINRTTMGMLAGVSSKTLIRQLGELEDRGVIVVKEDEGLHISNIATLSNQAIDVFT